MSMPPRLVRVSLLLVLMLPTGLVSAAPMSDLDRERLLTHMDMTESWLVSELAGLSPQQLRFKMTPESWSIMDVVEHLAVAEPQYWQNLQDSLKQPVSDKKPEATDAGILWYGIDRTNRQRTGDARVPKGRYDDVRRSLADFRTLRATMREYARATQDDLRGHMLLGGDMDVWQWFLMISTHSQRHILQIREIKAHPDYPRS